MYLKNELKRYFEILTRGL